MSETKGSNMTIIKYQNRALILNIIKNRGAVSRVDIAQALQLTPAAITILVNDMVKEGIIKEIGPVEEEDRKLGRKKVLIDINYDYKYAVGINIEPDLTNIGISNIKGDVIASSRFETDRNMEPENLLNMAASECMKLLWKENIMKEKVLGAGVGIVGLVDKSNGVSKRAYGLWKKEVNVKGILEGALDTRVVVDNNVRALAIGEIDYHSREDMSNVLFIKYGPGVGSAIIIDNEIYYGANNFSGEIGHTMAVPDGELCRCGRRGCLETVVSRHVIIDKVKKIFSPEETPELYRLCGGDSGSVTMNMICGSAEAGDKNVLEIVREAMYHMSVAISNAVCFYDPHNVIIFGEVFKCKAVMDILKDYTREFIINKDIDDFISISKLNNKSNYIGGIALALREFFYNIGGM